MQNSADPDQIAPQHSDQDLYCFPFYYVFYETHKKLKNGMKYRKF